MYKTFEKDNLKFAANFSFFKTQKKEIFYLKNTIIFRTISKSGFSGCKGKD
jgi:hypothetical protein